MKGKPINISWNKQSIAIGIFRKFVHITHSSCFKNNKKILTTTHLAKFIYGKLTRYIHISSYNNQNILTYLKHF